MYRMKKIYDIPDNMNLPDNMYRMKPINANLNSSSLTGMDSVHALINGNDDKASAKVLRELNKPETKRKSETDLQFENRNNRQSKRKRSKSPVKKDTILSPMDTAEDIVLNTSDKETQKLMHELEKRQKDVIARLLKLKAALDGKPVEVELTKYESCTGIGEIRKRVDAVVHADVDNLPLSVLVMAKKLRESYGNEGVSCQSHVHSSCAGALNAAAKSFADSFVSKNGSHKSSTCINLTVIWKSGSNKDPEMVVEPQNPPLTGEANIIRYLSRLLPMSDSLNYDNLPWDDILRVDGLLEKRRDVTNDKSLDDIETQLKSTKSFVFGELTLADVGLYSYAEGFLQKNKGAATKLPMVKQWLDRCKALAH